MGRGKTTARNLLLNGQRNFGIRQRPEFKFPIDFFSNKKKYWDTLARLLATDARPEEIEKALEAGYRVNGFFTEKPEELDLRWYLFEQAYMKADRSSNEFDFLAFEVIKDLPKTPSRSQVIWEAQFKALENVRNALTIKDNIAYMAKPGGELVNHIVKNSIFGSSLCDLTLNVYANDLTSAIEFNLNSGSQIFCNKCEKVYKSAPGEALIKEDNDFLWPPTIDKTIQVISEDDKEESLDDLIWNQLCIATMNFVLTEEGRKNYQSKFLAGTVGLKDVELATASNETTVQKLLERLNS